MIQVTFLTSVQVKYRSTHDFFQAWREICEWWDLEQQLDGYITHRILHRRMKVLVS